MQNVKETRVSLPLAGSTGGYIGQQVDPARTINMYNSTINGQQTPALIAFPGSSLEFTNPTGDQARNTFQTGNLLFAVFSDQLVVYNTDLLSSTSFTINTVVGVANFSGTNSQQVILVDGVDGWVYDFSGVPTFTQISDSTFTSFNNPLDVAYLDGHIFVVFGSGNTWLLSNFEDAATYQPLNEAHITAAPNQFLTGVRVSSSRVYFFGTSISEVWYPTEVASTFPFKRDSNATISMGCASNRSIAVGAIQVKSLYRIFPDIENAVIWLGQWPQGSPKVMMASMGTSNTISDFATEYKIQKMAVVNDAVGTLITINGHTFYILTFPTENLSLLYDFDMKEWTELQMLDKSYYFVSCHAMFNNKHYVGSLKTATLSEMRDEYSSNNGEAIHCVRTTSIFNLPSYERLSIPRFEVEMRAGTGNKTTTPINSAEYSDFNIDPQIYLSHSEDGGYHFSQQRPLSTGAVGQPQWKVFWQGFPVSPRHVFRLETFNATKTVFMNAFAQIQNMGY